MILIASALLGEIGAVRPLAALTFLVAYRMNFIVGIVFSIWIGMSSILGFDELGLDSPNVPEGGQVTSLLGQTPTGLSWEKRGSNTYLWR